MHNAITFTDIPTIYIPTIYSFFFVFFVNFFALLVILYSSNRQISPKN